MIAELEMNVYLKSTVSILSVFTININLLKASECPTAYVQNQKKDAASVLALEKSWSTARRKLDIAFEKCLLDRGLVEILKTGEIKGFDYEISGSPIIVESTREHRDLDKRLAYENSKTINVDSDSIKKLRFWRTNVLTHDRLAIAYGRLRSNSLRAQDNVPFADYFIWQQASWHVFLAIQTIVPPSINW